MSYCDCTLCDARRKAREYVDQLESEYQQGYRHGLELGYMRGIRDAMRKVIDVEEVKTND